MSLRLYGGERAPGGRGDAQAARRAESPPLRFTAVCESIGQLHLMAGQV